MVFRNSQHVGLLYGAIRWIVCSRPAIFQLPGGRSHVTCNDVNTTQTNSRLMSTVQSVKFACAGSFDI